MNRSLTKQIDGERARGRAGGWVRNGRDLNAKNAPLHTVGTAPPPSALPSPQRCHSDTHTLHPQTPCPTGSNYGETAAAAATRWRDGYAVTALGVFAIITRVVTDSRLPQYVR